MAGYIGSKAVLLSTTAATVTGDMTVDTSTLKVDSTNNLVGIGTASPTSALHVSGGAGTNIAIQSSAGTHWRIGDGVGSTNGNLVIYDYSDSRKVFEIDTLGHITKPVQPAFCVEKASTDQANIAINTNTELILDLEKYDNNGDFSSNTFTAPVSGRYQLNVAVVIRVIDSAADYYRIRLSTSNKTFETFVDPDFGQDNSFTQLGLCVTADMDANDTAKVHFYQAGGTAQSDLVYGENYFSGFLAC